MPHPTLTLHHPSCKPPDAIEAAATPERAEALHAAIDGLPSSTRWILLDGARPATHPELPALLRHARDRGLRVRLLTDAAGLDPERLLALLDDGLEILRLRLHGSASAHDLLTGRVGAGAQAVALAHAARGSAGCKLELHTTLATPVLDALPELIDLAHALSAPIYLEPMPTGRLPERLAALRPRAEAVAAALGHARARADALGVRLHADALAGPPPPPTPTDAAPPLGPLVWSFLHHDVPQPDLVGGVRAAQVGVGQLEQLAQLAGGAQEVGLQLAAMRCPPVDLPAQLGGPGPFDPAAPLPASWAALIPPEQRGALPVWTAPPGLRVAVFAPPISDKVMTLCTLPALARALHAHGADVRLHSVWGDAEDRAPVTSGPGRRAQLASVEARWEDLLRTVDLSDRDLVLVPGFDAAAEVYALPSLPTHARLVIADFHLLAHIDRWTSRYVAPGARSMDHGWWPDERVHVHSCFPSFSRLYRLAGVPQRQILWRPYPFDLRRFSPGPPPSTGEAGFAGGNQQRAWASLAAASARLADAQLHPIDLYTRQAPPGELVGPLRYRGTVDLDVFHHRLAQARYCVVPVGWNPHGAAGLTVIAMALAAGRPVVSTLTGGTLDHLRHGEDALLVPPADPRALAAALHHLDHDPALLDALGQGAQRAAQALSVDRWAEELLRGGEPIRAHGNPGGPWRSWGPTPHDPKR